MHARWAHVLGVTVLASACGRDINDGPIGDSGSSTGGSAQGGGTGGSGATGGGRGGRGGTGGSITGGAGGSITGGAGGSITGGTGDSGCLYPDLDGDGYGSDLAADASCGDPLGAPLNAVSRSGDCDDSDSGVAPDVFDYPNDGVDSDCFNGDSTLDCAGGVPTCPCATLLTSTVEVNPSCETFDAAILDVTPCGACGGAFYYVRLANLGPEPILGPLRLAVEGYPPVRYLIGLDPGEISPPIVLPQTTAFEVAKAVTVSIDDPADCDPTNDTATLDPRPPGLCVK